MAAYAAGFASLSVLRHRAFMHRPLRPREHGADGLEHGARPLPPDDERRRSADLAPGRALRPDPRRLRAALVDLAEPGDAARRPGGRGRPRRAARCSGSRASISPASAPALGFALVYLLYPATEWLTLNEFHPVALACPVPAVRVLVPRRGPAAPLRRVRRAGDDDEGGDRARRRRDSGSGTRSRRRTRAGDDRSPSPGCSSRRSRSRS